YSCTRRTPGTDERWRLCHSMIGAKMTSMEANAKLNLPVVRAQFDFRRTRCGCEFCTAPCRHIPGSLDVSDLSRLCPPTQDLFSWAEEHLVALTDKPFPTLVPARQA